MKIFKELYQCLFPPPKPFLNKSSPPMTMTEWDFLRENNLLRKDGYYDLDGKFISYK